MLCAPRALQVLIARKLKSGLDMSRYGYGEPRSTLLCGQSTLAAKDK
jgi:hypothetical protein